MGKSIKITEYIENLFKYGGNMDRATALGIVREFVKNENLVRHMLAVEAAMRFYAQKFGEDVESWGLIGLLHDFDWEIHPTLEQHPMEGAPILRARGVPEDWIQDILSHANHTGVPRNTLRRKALFACDEVTGLITAVALVRPSRSLLDLEMSSVKKKWKERSGLSQMKLKSRHFENYPISGNQKPLRAFFTHIWGYFVQCDYTLLRMTDQ
jgi:putative nucleotidyltransferase with HDIG domain